MTTWLLIGFFLTVILLAMIRDARRDGVLEARRDWFGFAAFPVSSCGIGGVAWWLAGAFWPDQRTAGTVFLVIAGVLFVQAGLARHNRRRQAKAKTRNGFLTKQEWCRRADSVLASIEK